VDQNVGLLVVVVKPFAAYFAKLLSKTETQLDGSNITSVDAILYRCLVCLQPPGTMMDMLLLLLLVMTMTHQHGQ
jgi:hypothetical protein